MRIVTDINLHIAVTDKGNLCPRLQIYNGNMKADFWEFKNIAKQIDDLIRRANDMKDKAAKFQDRCDAEYVKTQRISEDSFTKQDILDLLQIDIDLINEHR